MTNKIERLKWWLTKQCVNVGTGDLRIHILVIVAAVMCVILMLSSVFVPAPITVTISISGAYVAHVEYTSGGATQRICLQGRDGGYVSTLHIVDKTAPFLLSWEYTGDGIPDTNDGINIMYRWTGDVINKRFVQLTGNVETSLAIWAKNTPPETGNRVVVHDAGQLTLIQNTVQ